MGGSTVSKNVVILNGSPRKKGNTSALVKAFAEGAENAGHTVTEFFLDEKGKDQYSLCLFSQAKRTD